MGAWLPAAQCAAAAMTGVNSVVANIGQLSLGYDPAGGPG
jgi:hypothetical protein